MNMRCDEKGLVKIWNLSWFKIQWNSHFASMMGTRSPPVCQNTNPSIWFFLHFWEVDSIAASEITPGPGVEACWCSQKRKTYVFNGLWDSTAWHAQQSQVKAEVHFDSVNVGVEFTVHNPMN